jgi:hypothetical protein
MFSQRYTKVNCCMSKYNFGIMTGCQEGGRGDFVLNRNSTSALVHGFSRRESLLELVHFWTRYKPCPFRNWASSWQTEQLIREDHETLQQHYVCEARVSTNAMLQFVRWECWFVASHCVVLRNKIFAGESLLYYVAYSHWLCSRSARKYVW